MSRATSGICCLLGVDKPAGITSHDAVSKVRRALHERRVGHAGTLDPAATGVLVMGVGQATRLLGLLTLDEKTYEARIAFGAETSTDDAEGEVVRKAAVPDRLLDAGFAAEAVAGLVGVFDQVPPAYSAISVDGRRAYDRARSGEDVELAPRSIEVFEAELLGVEDGSEGAGGGVGLEGASGVGKTAGLVGADGDSRPRGVCWNVRLRVSKGTYVRAIARDLGRELGTAAHLTGLRRLSSGLVGIDDCLTLDELGEGGASALAGRELDPARALGLPARLLDPAELADVAVGRRLSPGFVIDLAGEGAGLRPPKRGERVSLVCGSRLYGVWRERGGQLVAETNFPDGIAGVRA